MDRLKIWLHEGAKIGIQTLRKKLEILSKPNNLALVCFKSCERNHVPHNQNIKIIKIALLNSQGPELCTKACSS